MQMQPERHGPDLNTCEVDWKHAWRIIATRFPPIDLFERVSADPAVWEALMDLEQATNPRVRDDIGEIALVPPHRRVGGPNASWVMAPFTHVNPRGSRFSPGNFGVYYCADSLKTGSRRRATISAGSRPSPPTRPVARICAFCWDRCAANFTI